MKSKIEEDIPSRKGSRKRRNKKSRKYIYVGLFLFGILFISLIGYAAHLHSKAKLVFSEAYTEIDRDKSELRDVEIDPKFDNFSILIIVVDENDKRGGDNDTRSDTLMLTTLNKNEKGVKLLSTPRDSYVYIPDLEYETRINHAYKAGGIEGTISTVENLLNVPIGCNIDV